MKQNKKSCFCLQKVFRKMSMVEFISEKVTDTAACTFLETNSTAIVCRNFHIYFKQRKWNKLPLPLGRSQENVHDVVHFWNSYRYCCSQLFKKELHFSQLEGLLQKLWNKINKKVVSAFSTFQRKCLHKEVHFRRIYWVLPPTFWKKNSTVVISKVFSKNFETKQIKKLSLPSELFQKNNYDEVYFWKNYRLLPPTLTQINSIVAISREFSKSFETKKRLILMKCIRWNHFRKKYRRLLCIFFKIERILRLSFQKQPPDVFYEKSCP